MKVHAGLMLCAGAGVALCALLWNVSAIAQEKSESAPASAYKIGIVDLKDALKKYERHTNEAAALEAEVKAENDKLDQRSNALKSEMDDFDKRRDSMGEDDRIKKGDQLKDKYRQFQIDVKKAEDDLETKKARLKQSLIADMVKAIDDIGKRDNYHLILEADPETRTGVMYYHTTLDMTPKVIEQLNRAYQQGGGKSSARADSQKGAKKSK